jgi:ATP-binding cassette subfamily B protein
MSAYTLENFSGIRVVQAYAQEENQIRGFSRTSSEYRKRTMWLATLWGIFWPLMQVHAGIAATIVLWLGGRQVLAGTMSLGEYVAFNGYLAMLTWPLMAIGYTANQYQRGTAALTRIAEVLDTPVGARYASAAGSEPAGAVRGDIELRDLTFSYGADQAAELHNLNLHIPAGKSCGIIGETGSGKSTLVNLMLRLYEPAENTILIDGIDIRRMPVRQLEDAVGYVSQDIFLFSGSVRENILLGVENGGLAQVAEASRIAQLLPTLESFGAGFDTVIGERGVRLSGGQSPVLAVGRRASVGDGRRDDRTIGTHGARAEEARAQEEQGQARALRAVEEEAAQAEGAAPRREGGSRRSEAVALSLSFVRPGWPLPAVSPLAPSRSHLQGRRAHEEEDQAAAQGRRGARSA